MNDAAHTPVSDHRSQRERNRNVQPILMYADSMYWPHRFSALNHNSTQRIFRVLDFRGHEVPDVTADNFRRWISEGAFRPAVPALDVSLQIFREERKWSLI